MKKEHHQFTIVHGESDWLDNETTYGMVIALEA